MTKVEARTPKGFRDFLGPEAKNRDLVVQKLKKIFERFGFEPLDTPVLEYAEVLKGKYGEEEKLIYEFEDRGGRQLAMRYDQTVPLARIVANYPNLTKPYKRYQIQNVYRAENPQKGRYREFLQVDFDTVGTPSLLAEAEIIACVSAVMEELGFTNYTIKVNDRDVFATLPPSVITSIDKLNKIGEAGVVMLLKNQGFSDFQSRDILKKITESTPTKTINELFNMLEKMKVRKDVIAFDPTLARGLDYYTGTIFELEIEGYTAGSVGGGGRYDKLIGVFADNNFPAVGFSFGFDRLIEAMEALKLLKKEETGTKFLVTVFNEDLLKNSLEVVEDLRKLGINTEVYLDFESKLDKQIKYADSKKIPFVVILGPEEIENKAVSVKNLKNGQQKQVKLSQLKSLIDTKS